MQRTGHGMAWGREMDFLFLREYHEMKQGNIRTSRIRSDHYVDIHL
jgi:hypothetical protein